MSEYEQYLVSKWLETHEPSVVAEDAPMKHISYERLGSK